MSTPLPHAGEVWKDKRNCSVFVVRAVDEATRIVLGWGYPTMTHFRNGECKRAAIETFETFIEWFHR